MTAQSKTIVIYQISNGENIKIPIDHDTAWLSINQIAQLFNTDRSSILKHVQNVYKESELSKKATYAKIAQVQIEGKRSISRRVDFYNLDMVLSVGYRVNSKKATQFRIWATQVLRKHILDGYTINKSRLADTGIDELERAVNLIRQTLNSPVLTSGEAKDMLKVVADYAHAWIIFHKYDEGKIGIRAKTQPKYTLTINDARELITKLVTQLRDSQSAAKFVGMDREGEGLDRIIGSINQTYAGKELYKTVEEKAAHLLYFVIKDHPLIDGNKRSGSLLFIHYLAQNGLLFRDSGERTINDNTIVALALLISQSHPGDKEIMIHLITNLLQ